MKPRKTGLKRIVSATGYSLLGLVAAYKHEAAFRQEFWLCIILVPLAIWLGETGVERALLLASLFLVLIVELLNSAIEVTVDRISSEFSELSGRAKDIASAAVMLSILNLFIIWVLVLWQRIILYISN